jgi:hypothetical protein
MVVLEEQGVPEALSDASSAGREGWAYVMLVIFYKDWVTLFTNSTLMHTYNLPVVRRPSSAPQNDPFGG